MNIFSKSMLSDMDFLTQTQQKELYEMINKHFINRNDLINTGELFGIPISHIQLIDDAFKYDGYNLKDKEDLKQIGLRYFKKELKLE